MTKIEQILEKLGKNAARIVFKTEFVVKDLITCADEEQLSILAKMNESELEAFIENNIDSWKKGFENGLMFD
jgi:hypothetical protein